MIDHDKITDDLYALQLQLAGCTLAKTAKKDNWVDNAGGLPEYICEIARALVRSGKSTGTAISIAVSRCKRWAAGLDGVNADTKAKAAAAIASWEKKKASSHVKASANIDTLIALASHDLIWYANRNTPEVVPSGKEGKFKGGKYGRVVKRRKATDEEEKKISSGDWLRVNKSGDKPGDSGYHGGSKARPQLRNK